MRQDFLAGTGTRATYREPVASLDPRSLAAQGADGHTIEQYAVELLQSWRQDERSQTYGMLLLVAAEDRTARSQLGGAHDETERKLFTVEEYHRMAEAGIFGADERIELIEGEIVQMTPIGARHVGCVINATRLFLSGVGDRAVVSPQNPVVIAPRSEPQPDLLRLRPRAVSYSREFPTSQDVLLAVEVADTAARFDRLVKARLYARAGIAEFWLCLPRDGAVEVYRERGAEGYADVPRHGPGQTVSPLAFPEVSFAVTHFFA